MERVKALADKFNEQLAQNADSVVLRQTAIQILSELEAIPIVNQLPNNVSVIMPSVDYPQNVPIINKVVQQVVTEKPVLIEKPKEVFTVEPIVIKKEVADKIALEPIKDLRAAIGINDKFQFMETLFNKEEVVFESSIKTINAFKNFAEAQFWIKQNLRNKYQWEDESAVVIAFDQLVKRRFS